MVKVEIDTSTLGVLIAGLYTFNALADANAVPVSMYLEVANQLKPYLEKWDYEKMSFEDWIKNELMIYPKVMFSEDELNECKDNDIFIELVIGNVILIATARCYTLNE